MKRRPHMGTPPTPSPGGITSAAPQPQPIVHPDRTVSFRVHAPDARVVQVRPLGDDNGMGPGPYDMEADDDGHWVATIGPVRPGFHYYLLSVDGMECLDPYAEPCFGWARVCNGLDVPDPDQPYVQPRGDVPHGQLRLCWYDSPLTGRLRRCVVYTPPGYDRQPDRRFPVLHLQHGSGESERGWSWQGRANVILDNLFADGEAVEMIVAMDNGYAARPGAEDPSRPRGQESIIEDVWTRELIPWVDATFRTVADRSGRAIAGLSMGAGQAMRVGLAHPELFASVGALSGGGRNFEPETSFGGFFADPAAANENLDLLWIGCGRQDRGFAGAKSMHERLAELGAAHEWLECDGAHEWHVWRRCFHDLARKLFRP